MILRIKPLLLPALFIIACCTKTETTPTPPPAPDPVPVDSVTVSPAAFSLVAYDSIRLAAKVFPDSAADNKPVWISSNPSVATVDSCGMVRALAFGSVEITASAGGKTASSRGFIEKFSSFELMTVDPLTKILRKAVEKEMDYPLDVARGETATVQVRIFANARTSDLTAELLYFCKEGSAAGTLLEPKMYWDRHPIIPTYRISEK